MGTIDQKDRNSETSLDEHLFVLGTFALGMAHDLKNPIWAIEVLARDALVANEPTRWRSSLEAIIDAAERCQHVIEGMSLFVAEGVFARRPVDLTGVIARAVERASTGSANPLVVDVQIERNARMVGGSAPALEIALVNLLRNAAQSSTGECHVLLRAERAADGTVLTCSDDGPGIPDEVIAHLSHDDPAPRRGRSGRGLGLPIAQRILLAHGASFRIERRAERGTTFVIEFPPLV